MSAFANVALCGKWVELRLVSEPTDVDHFEVRFNVISPATHVPEKKLELKFFFQVKLLFDPEDAVHVGGEAFEEIKQISMCHVLEMAKQMGYGLKVTNKLLFNLAKPLFYKLRPPELVTIPFVYTVTFDTHSPT